MSKHYGYMRVSTLDQNPERQRIELLRWGIAEENIFCDRLSGKNFNRPAYQSLKKQLKKGDLVVVKSIDRLGRSYDDIKNEWREIVKVIRADIVILDMPILDTRRTTDLMGTLIADIVLELLSYVAQTERDNIRQRQAEGIALAKAQGKHLGRIPKPLPEGFLAIYQKWIAGEYTLATASQTLGVSVSSFRHMICKYRKHALPECET